MNLAPVNTASQMSPTHLHPPAPGWVGDGRAVPASHPLPLTPAYPHLPAGDSYQMSAATALPWSATLHHLPAPGRAGDSHLMPAATALPLPTARHHLPVPSRAGDAHTTPRMWTAPATSPPSGSSGCSSCCSAAVLSPPGLIRVGGRTSAPGPLLPSASSCLASHQHSSRRWMLRAFAGSSHGNPTQGFVLDLLLVALLRLHLRASVSMIVI